MNVFLYSWETQWKLRKPWSSNNNFLLVHRWVKLIMHTKEMKLFFLVLDCLNLNKTFLLHFIFSFNKGDSQKKKLVYFRVTRPPFLDDVSILYTSTEIFPTNGYESFLTSDTDSIFSKWWNFTSSFFSYVRELSTIYYSVLVYKENTENDQ